MLAEQRGKYATLPGANGAVTLNAAELRQAANDEITECMQEIFDYVADKPEDYGSGTQFILGTCKRSSRKSIRLFEGCV